MWQAHDNLCSIKPRKSYRKQEGFSVLGAMTPSYIQSDGQKFFFDKYDSISRRNYFRIFSK
jgi:hypothetical protein